MIMACWTWLFFSEYHKGLFSKCKWNKMSLSFHCVCFIATHTRHWTIAAQTFYSSSGSLLIFSQVISSVCLCYWHHSLFSPQHIVKLKRDILFVLNFKGRSLWKPNINIFSVTSKNNGMNMSKKVNPLLSCEVNSLIKCFCILCEHKKKKHLT